MITGRIAVTPFTRLPVTRAAAGVCPRCGNTTRRINEQGAGLACHDCLAFEVL